MPFSGQERLIRMIGEKTTIGGFAKTLNKVRSKPVEVEARPRSEAEQGMIDSFRKGDEDGETYWALVEHISNGQSTVVGELSHDLYNTKPRDLETALKAWYADK